MNSKKSKNSHESRSSRTSRETKSLNDIEIEEKMKVTELKLLQQKQMIQNKAETLKIKERFSF